MNVVPFPDQDQDLRADIRLLGRVLGDTVREQQGDAVFAIVERIRQISIQFRRNQDEQARHELESILDNLSRERTVEIVRAFSYFSHLANIAEDQHSMRQARLHARRDSAPPEGSFAHALARAKAAGIGRARIQEVFGNSLVMAVLTAHPTEVRRKSILDREMEIARLLADRDGHIMTPDELSANDLAIARAVLTLWQTSLIRHERPTVIDEVANGLSYYDQTFLRELPRVYAAIEDQLDAYDQTSRNVELPSFQRMGSWIGGDRDGNPFVTAGVLQSAVAMHSRKAFDFYLDELHELGAELSLDRARVSTSMQLQDLVGRLPDTRHAGLRSLIAAPLSAFTRGSSQPHVCSAMTCGRAMSLPTRPPTLDSAELRADLDVLHRSLQSNGSALIARGRLRDLRRAVAVFGFHLASLDLRQNSDKHEQVLTELIEVATGKNYAALDEKARRETLLAELASPRPLHSPYISYSEQSVAELDIFRNATDAHHRYGRMAIPNYVISHTETVSDILEALLLLKEVGLVRPREASLTST